jgi:L-threonine-O-3-phosphate decarboxylase
MNRINTYFKEIQPRKDLQNLKPVHHGAPNYGELEAAGFEASQVIDFSSNCNPFGPAPAVWESLSGIPLDRYPDRDCLALRRAITAHHDIELDSILVANGTAELIWLIALAYLNPGERVLILGPTFGEYANAAGIMGALVEEIRAPSENNFTWPQELTNQLANQPTNKLIFICNPNNPSGQIFSIEELNSWVDNHPQTLFVVDEAYAAFAADHQSSIHNQQSNLLVMRSMTKDYALAGLRLGYAVADPHVIQALHKVQPPWNVNALAQEAGLAALREQDYLDACLDQLQREKLKLMAELEKMGYKPIPSKTHFFLLPVNDGAAFRARLFQEGLQVRDCASFGLPAYVRIAARLPEENQKLLKAIERASTENH